MLAALIVLCVIAMSYLLCQKKKNEDVDNYTKLIQEIQS